MRRAGLHDVRNWRIISIARHSDAAGVHNQDASGGDDAWNMRMAAEYDARLPYPFESCNDGVLSVQNGVARTNILEKIFEVSARWASVAGEDLFIRERERFWQARYPIKMSVRQERSGESIRNAHPALQQLSLMVSGNRWAFEANLEVSALGRIEWSRYEVAKIDDLVERRCAYVSQDGFKGHGVSVNVSNNSDAHETVDPYRWK